MGFDPASFGSGFGAGQQQGRAAETHALQMANIFKVKAAEQESRANSAEASLKSANNEIINRWIPYGIRLRASLIARIAERDALIEELKKANPDNVDIIVQNLIEARINKYEEIVQSGTQSLFEINNMVRQESETSRLDK